MISLLGLLLFFIALSIPVAFSIALAVGGYLLLDGRFPAEILLQRAVAGVNSFPMLALPLFILVGYLMELGSTARLMRLANAILGRVPGGLAVANVGASAMFGAVSGSGVATIAAVGSVMGPEMVRRGYPKGYAASIMATSGGLGILIPPSLPLIIFGLIGSVSIGALFIGAIIPGLLTASLLGVAAMLLAYWKSYGSPQAFSWRELAQASVAAIPPLLLPIIILGGILRGLFTATEAAAIGVVYATFLGGAVYRQVTFSRLVDILVRTVITSSVILIIISMSAAFAWIVTVNQVPNLVASWLMTISQSPFVVMLLIQFFFIILGMFLETIAIIIITTPIFLPIAVSLGFDPIVYGIILILNLIVGSVTPPLAVGIYTASRIIGAGPMEVNRFIAIMMLPLLLSLLVNLAFPDLTLLLPRYLGM